MSLRPPHEPPETYEPRVPPERPQPEFVDAERKKARRAGFIVLGVLCVIMPTLWIISVKRNGPIDTMVPAPPPLDPPVIEYQSEMRIVPSNTGKPTRHDVAFSIGSILKEAKACMSGFGGTVFLSWQVNPDGSASDVQFETPPGGLDMSRIFKDTCLPAVVARARVSPYDGAPVRVTYPFRNMLTPEEMRGVAKMLMGATSGSGAPGNVIVVPTGAKSSASP